MFQYKKNIAKKHIIYAGKKIVKFLDNEYSPKAVKSASSL